MYYRGINKFQYEAERGKLLPKGRHFVYYIKFGTFKFGETKFGKSDADSERKSLIGHQENSNVFKTSGVSFTPHYKRALYYAFHNNKFDEGYVIAVDRDRFIKYSITEFIVKEKATKYYFDVKFPEDDEVILVHKDDGELPKGIITDIFFVKRN